MSKFLYISSWNYLFKSPLENKRERGSNYLSIEFDMLFLTPLFLQIRICTRFCYTWELSHFKGLLKQKHYPQRTYLRLTFNYCLQCTGDLDKRWHIALRSIHSIHLYGFTYYIPTEQFIYIYPCLVHPSPHHPYYIHSILGIIYLVSTWLRFFTRNIKHRIIFRCLKKN